MDSSADRACAPVAPLKRAALASGGEEGGGDSLYPLLSRIREPQQIKAFSLRELEQLAGELRAAILDAVQQHGGHMASNFGTVELTLALHYVFCSPRDALVWDVGHQCYAHKMLTGRLAGFVGLRERGGLAGFPRRQESEHDFLNVGHASTAISAALGLLEGWRHAGRKGKVVAIVGDGSLTGGMAFEALNHLGHLRRDLLVVLNDNSMSIARNVGAFSATLSRLTASLFYTRFRNRIDRWVERIPLIGKAIGQGIARAKAAVKAWLFFRNNLFNNLGLKYVGPFDGHNLAQLIRVLARVSRLDEPVLLHLVTTKGRGHSGAECNPIKFHGLPPAAAAGETNQPTFTQVFAQGLCELAAQDSRILAITAAMPSGTGLNQFKERFPDRFYDVGIAEQHAVTLAVGLALAGMRPVVAIYSTFMQRAVDQVIHDATLQGLPIIFAMDRSGLVPADGDTHQGIYDISLFKPLPGVTMLAPACAEELRQVWRYLAGWSGGPVFLRYPKACCPSEPRLDIPLIEGRGSLLRSPLPGLGKLLLCCTGALWGEALIAQGIMAARAVGVDLYNLCFIKPIDGAYWVRLLQDYRAALVVEDGVVSGGIGQQLLHLAVTASSPCRVVLQGVHEQIAPVASYAELLHYFALDGASLAQRLATMEEAL